MGAWGQSIRLKAQPDGRPAHTTARGSHLILQFPGYPDQTVRQALTLRGIHILQYVPDNGLMVTAPPTVDLSGLNLLWAGSLSASDKMSPVLDDEISGPVLAIFHSDVAPQRARLLSRSLGFDVLENAGLLEHQLVLSGPLTRLAELAALDELAYVLPASPELAAGIPVAGCDGAVTEAGPVGEYVLAGKGWAADSAGKVALQYFIRNLTEKLASSTARGEIERALREWTKYANLSLSPGQQGAPRTIDIFFGRGAHGDAYPFDGPGGTLAHTFYPAPPNQEPAAGDMHLDSDEPWRSGTSLDLFSVVLHEAGHALGLAHSDRPGTVMYPYYHQVSGLTDDDIAGIRALYGTPSGGGTSHPPVTPAAPDTTAPTLQVLSPAFTIVSTSAAGITLSGIANDNLGIAQVKWTASTGFAGKASGTTNWNAVIPLLTGTNVITVRAYDAAGNSSWRAITVVRR